MGFVEGKEFLLIWVLYFKLFNIVVVNFVLLIVLKFGMNVCMFVLDEVYCFDECYMLVAEVFVGEVGFSLMLIMYVEVVYFGVDVVYVKSWGVLLFYGNWDDEVLFWVKGVDFMIILEKMVMINNGVVSYCLLMCCNVKIVDVVVDSLVFFGIEEVGNCLYV